MADERLFYYFFSTGGILQIVSSEFIVIDSDILVINAGAIEMTYRLAFQFDLAFGILTAAIGLLLLLRPKAVINLVLLVCGILILTDGLFKIQIALDARGFGIRRWWLILMTAVAAGGFGLLLILKPDAGMATAMVLLGVALVLDALLTFAAMLLLVKIIRHQRPDIIDVEGEEVT